MEPAFFQTPAAFRQWLERNHDKETALLVGLYKHGSGRPSITWPEAVDEALCLGWIDGVRRSVGPHSYTIRFTPRKPRSIWSTRNVERVRILMEQGLMAPAGIAAFERRREDRTGIYSFERDQPAQLPPDQQRRFEANGQAWTWFSEQAPWYRRTAVHWVTSAKRSETRERRLAQLVTASAAGRTVRQLTWSAAASRR